MNLRRILKSKLFMVLFLGLIGVAIRACAPMQEAQFQKEDQAEDNKSFNSHCRDPKLARQLRALGPLYVVGASVSYGLFAKSFPELIAEQMCLDKKSYDADFGFLVFYKSSRTIRESILKLRPKIIVALDYPYHHVKLKYADIAEPILEKHVTMLLLQCQSPLLDCSDGGPHQFLRSDSYRPTVFAGTVYFNCKLETVMDEPKFPNYEICRRENKKLNVFYRELEKRYPNLHLLPIFEVFSTFHDTEDGKFHYDVDGVKRTFTKDELFFDGFHPITDPGAYVIANLVIDWINRVNKEKYGDDFVSIPFIPIKAKPDD